MEPVQIGRDDPVHTGNSGAVATPQWSPSRSDGMTLCWLASPSAAEQPQWSPSRSDGMTRCHGARRGQGAQAAMEPVQIGRDDVLGLSTWGLPGSPPQWSPSRSDGMTGARGRDPFLHRFAAMEPVQIGRDDIRRAVLPIARA